MSELARMLSVEDVLSIHEVLVQDFIAANDPISPAGVKSQALLESAVARQWSGFGGTLKYPDALSNAATLCYGLCCNHAFHNGNKRTALVSMLCHLDKNNRTLKPNIDEQSLYQLMIRIADHRMGSSAASARDSSDQEVQGINRWLRNWTREVKLGERSITYRDLRRNLRRFGIELENPHKNSIDVVRYTVEKPYFWSNPRRIAKKLMTVGYPGDNGIVGKGVIKQIRKQCNLTENDEIDSDVFYGDEEPIGVFVTRYKRTLTRLART